MAQILAYAALPWPGHVYPFVALLLELQRRGHDVVLATGPGLVPDSVGLRVRHASNPVAHPERAGEGGDPGIDLTSEAGVFSALGAPAAADLDRLRGEEAPDLLVVDPMLWGAGVSAEASGLPWATVAHNCALIPALGLRLVGPGLPPPRGIRDRVRRLAAAARAQRRIDAYQRDSMNDLRTRYRLPLLAHAQEHLRRAPLTLAATAEPFEYPRLDWAPSVRFVGPLSWDPPGYAPAWLERLDDRPLLLVVGSSLAQGDALLADVATGALSDGRFHVVLTPPAGTPPAARPYVHVAPGLSHSLVLPRTACVVCHGGTGITHKALSAGVPVVAVPFARDQREVAQRVASSGAGVRIDPETLTPARLRAAVDEALGRRAGAQRVAAAFAAAGGAAAAAIMLDKILRRPGTP